MTATQTRALAIGTSVYCTVHRPWPLRGTLGWFRVTAVRPSDGYLKIEGHRTWNPPHNFEMTANGEKR